MSDPTLMAELAEVRAEMVALQARFTRALTQLRGYVDKVKNELEAIEPWLRKRAIFLEAEIKHGEEVIAKHAKHDCGGCESWMALLIEYRAELRALRAVLSLPN